MMDMAVCDRPEWWNNGVCGTSKKAKLQKFNQEIAMHFYCTATSFTCIEDPHLLRAVQLLRPGARLPTRKQLADDRWSARDLLSESQGRSGQSVICKQTVHLHHK